MFPVCVLVRVRVWVCRCADMRVCVSLMIVLGTGRTVEVYPLWVPECPAGCVWVDVSVGL